MMINIKFIQDCLIFIGGAIIIFSAIPLLIVGLTNYGCLMAVFGICLIIVVLLHKIIFSWK